MLWTLLFVFFGRLAPAATISPCTLHLAAGELCLYSPHKIRPTQFNIGLREVEYKSDKLKLKAKDSNEALDKALRKDAIEAVIGPGGEIYAIDGHHATAAAIRAGLDNVYVHIVRNYANLSHEEFFQKMAAKKWLYLYDLGIEKDVAQLGDNVSEMTDDPYRSLASAVKRAGGFAKSDEHFSEFIWANFFRKYVPIEAGDDGFHKSVSSAFVLARSPLAKDLPGYMGWDKDCASALEAIQPPPPQSVAPASAL